MGCMIQDRMINSGIEKICFVVDVIWIDGVINGQDHGFGCFWRCQCALLDSEKNKSRDVFVYVFPKAITVFDSQDIQQRTTIAQFGIGICFENQQDLKLVNEFRCFKMVISNPFTGMIKFCQDLQVLACKIAWKSWTIAPTQVQ
ncbi:hypothetical protein OZ13_20335 [Xanthomonas cannabis pv. cannabis]|nr:hypothetical protein OZ13_20335 [Xanthomonas cannabis pv. cannabis]